MRSHPKDDYISQVVPALALRVTGRGLRSRVVQGKAKAEENVPEQD